METIFAPSTQNVSAIKIIRISGPRAKEIPKIFGFAENTPKQYQIRKLKDKDKTIDTVPVIWLPGPNTYTGEDVFELHIHGALSVESKIYEILVKRNFRMAEKGEFTKRAVINGKIDLTQAEAVNDLINSETDKQLELANLNLEGKLKRTLYKWRNNLIELSSDIETLIDFSDEEVPEDLDDLFKHKLNILIKNIEKALEFSKYSSSLRSGFMVSIIGKTNVGKSSLMNRLVNKHVSIVTDIHGTTRDLIEVKINLKGFPVYIVDTAGIRKTNSKVEKLGISRTKEIILKSDIILNLSDKGEFSLPVSLKNNVIINVLTKNDLVHNNSNKQHLSISSKKNLGIDKLLRMIYLKLKNLEPKEPSFLTNLRQIKGSKVALNALKRIRKLSVKNETELIGEELRLASSAISDITSIVNIEEILDEIFSKFCIGK